MLGISATVMGVLLWYQGRDNLSEVAQKETVVDFASVGFLFKFNKCGLEKNRQTDICLFITFMSCTKSSKKSSIEGKLFDIIAVKLCGIMTTVRGVEFGALIDNSPSMTNNLLADPSTQDIVDLKGTDAPPDPPDGVRGHGPVVGEAEHERH